MHQILVYGDSLSWGIIPNTRRRLSFPERWPGVLETELLRQRHCVRVLENCLNGRRTAWEDPVKPGRSGIVGLEQSIEINSPLVLVMVMLGTNDFQSVHQNDAQQSAMGIGRIVEAVRLAPIEPGMATPEIMLIAPPLIRAVPSEIADKFAGAEERQAGHNLAIGHVAVETKCHFFDAGTVTTTSGIDGVHLDRNQHRVLAQALAPPVADILKTA